MLSVFVGPRLSRSFSLTRGELAASTEAKLMTFRCRRMQVGCWSAPLQLGIRRDMARPPCASLALVANPEALHAILKGHQPRQFGDRQSLTLLSGATARKCHSSWPSRTEIESEPRAMSYPRTSEICRTMSSRGRKPFLNRTVTATCACAGNHCSSRETHTMYIAESTASNIAAA